jgi:apolipoprotein N-acyltransferase
VALGKEGKPVNVGMLICYDAIFPEIVREYSTRDIDLFINITNDAWYGFSSAPFQFLRMVGMRAVESGRSVARVANTGVTAVMDPAGRILAQTGLGLIPGNETVDEAMHVPAMRLVHDVALVRDPPLYASIGDLFAWVFVILSFTGLLPARAKAPTAVPAAA